MATLEQRTGEYSLILKKRLGKWTIELSFFKGGTAVLHEETSRQRAEGVFWYLLDHSPDTARKAEEIISRKIQAE